MKTKKQDSICLFPQHWTHRPPSSRPPHMNHPLRCQCGTLRGHVSHTETVCRGVCYCKDCQAYAHFLGKADEMLDEMGGSDVVATLPQHVTFTQGFEALTCMSLSD